MKKGINKTSQKRKFWAVYKRLVLFILIALGLTSFITLILFPLGDDLPIVNNGTANNTQVTDLIPDNINNKSIIAEAIGVALNLSWYDIHVENNSYFKTSPCETMESGAPWLQIMFKNTNPDRYKKSNLEFVEGGNDPNHRRVNSGERGSFTYSGDEPISFGIVIMWIGEACETPSVESHNNLVIDYRVYARPNFTAWLAKFTIIFIFWLFILDVLYSRMDI